MEHNWISVPERLEFNSIKNCQLKNRGINRKFFPQERASATADLLQQQNGTMWTRHAI